MNTPWVDYIFYLYLQLHVNILYRSFHSYKYVLDASYSLYSIIRLDAATSDVLKLRCVSGLQVSIIIISLQTCKTY